MNNKPRGIPPRSQRLVIQITKNQEAFLIKKAQETGFHGKAGVAYKYLMDHLFGGIY